MSKGNPEIVATIMDVEIHFDSLEPEVAAAELGKGGNDRCVRDFANLTGLDQLPSLLDDWVAPPLKAEDGLEVVRLCELRHFLRFPSIGTERPLHVDFLLGFQSWESEFQVRADHNADHDKVNVGVLGDLCSVAVSFGRRREFVKLD